MTIEQWKQEAGRLMTSLVVPLARARALRRDDRAQVMVLTAVMIFVVSIFAIATLNTSEMLHNRIQNQTAVDAAADAYALWQARGLNLVQHTNDYHTEYNLMYLGETLLVCIARLICVSEWCGSWKKSFCKGDVRSCCNRINRDLERIEREQGLLAFAVHTTQKAIVAVTPRMGWITANNVAEAAGADAIMPGNLDTVINEKMNQLGVAPPYDASMVANFYPGPKNDVVVVPDRIPRIDVIPFTFPPYFNPGRCLGSSEFCEFSTCNGGSMPACLLTILLGGSLTGCMSGSSPNACNYTCFKAPADSDLLPEACGWSDWFFLGGPTAYTWIAARTNRNLVGWIDDIRWLNPISGTGTEPNSSATFPEVEYSEFDSFAFFDPGTGPAKQTNFVNTAFVTMASSHSIAGPEGTPQPAIMHKGPGFEYARPQIVNVHLHPIGLTDDLAEEKIIWH